MSHSPPRAFAFCRRGRVLIFEDTRGSQPLVQRALSLNGFEPRLVLNAADGVEQFIDTTYVAVLMDVEMPLLDGFECTAAIRAWEALEERPRTPIIALSAHSENGCDKRCLAAGMDEFLLKPVDADRLIACLEKWLPQSIGEGMDLAVDPVIVDLIPGFLDNRRADLQLIPQLLERSDFQTIQRLAHNMKGSGASYGMIPITELGAQMEAASVRRDTSAIERLHRELSRYVHSIRLSPDHTA